MTQTRKRREANPGADQSTRDGGSIKVDYSRVKPKLSAAERAGFRLAVGLKTTVYADSPIGCLDAIQTFAEANGFSTADMLTIVESAWENVSGDWRLETILSGFQGDPVPEVGNPILRADSRYSDALRVWARLQAHAGEDSWFLEVKRLADLLKIPRRQAQRYFNRAETDEVLVRVADEIPHKLCREWRMPAAVVAGNPEASRESESSAESRRSRESKESKASSESKESKASRESKESEELETSETSETSEALGTLGTSEALAALGRHSPETKQCPKCLGDGCKWCHNTGHITAEPINPSYPHPTKTIEEAAQRLVALRTVDPDAGPEDVWGVGGSDVAF